MKYFVTGGAGFIGSNLVDRLVQNGHHVVVYDNFSTGMDRFIHDAIKRPLCQLVKGDTLDLAAVKVAMSGSDFVFHLAANADVRFGLEHPQKDLEQNTIATFNVLEAMRSNEIRRIAFSSTGSVYGEPQVFPTPEEAPFPTQTSLYGASKLAGEGLIEAFCVGFGMKACIFRFVSIVGERYSHGHVFDFCKSLRKDGTRLRVLGDGKQRKSYLYIQDCIDAILTAVDKAHMHSDNPVQIFNLGTDEYCDVNQSIGWITEHLAVKPQLDYTGGERGWIGDNPFIFLDCNKIRSYGWSPKLSIREGIVRTVTYLQENPWIFDAR